MPTAKRWTRALILRRMRQWNRKYGEGPYANDWFKSPKKNKDGSAYWPSPSIVQREFGSWSAAKLAAGIEPVHSRKMTPQKLRRPKGYWTQEKIIAMLQECAAENRGIWPAERDWEPARNGDGKYPHPSVVMREFGTWNKAVIAAGGRPRVSGLTKKAIAQYLPLPRKEAP